MSAHSERSARARGGNTATNSAVVLTGRNQLLRNPASALLIRRRLVHRLNEVIAELLRQLYWPRRKIRLCEVVGSGAYAPQGTSGRMH